VNNKMLAEVMENIHKKVNNSKNHPGEKGSELIADSS